MKKLFESKKGNKNWSARCTNNFYKTALFTVLTTFTGQYLETIMVCQKILRMGQQKTHTQKTYKISIGFDSINVDFFGSSRQLDRIEISLVFDKDDKHTATYDSYNIKLAAKYINTVKLSNFTEMYSLTNEKKYDTDNLTQKHLLYQQFVAWSCNGCSNLPWSDYINNPVYQELID